MTLNRSFPPRGLRLIGALLVVLVLTTAGHARGAADAPTITDVEVRGNLLLSDEEVIQRVGVEQGTAYDAEGLTASVERWNQARQLGTVGYRVEPTESGDVKIILQVNERVALSSVQFLGNRRISAGRLREVAHVRPGDVVTPREVADVERAIEAAYAERGYPSCLVQGVLLLGEEGERDLLFTVSEGKRVKVGRTVFQGNEHIRRGRLLKAMESNQRRWFGWIFPRYFHPDSLESDTLRIKQVYWEEGFQDVEVRAFPSYPKEKKARLNIVIEEGPRYTVRRVLFDGNTLFRDDELREAIPVETGEPYNPAEVDNSLRVISGLYGNQGHVDVTERKGNLSAEPLFDAELPRVTLNFHITEGEAVYIRRVEIRGLTKTKEPVVRRNLAIYPDELATTDNIKRSEQLLVNSGFFDQTAQPPVEITLEPDEGALRDAVVRVKEGQTGQLMLGAGVGTDSGLLGEISLREQNFDITNWPSSWADVWSGNAFRGGGQRLALVLRSGTERSYYSLSFQDPAAWGSSYGLGGGLYSRGIVHEEWDETRTGINVTGSVRTAKFLERAVTVGYENIEVEDVDPAAAPVFLRDEGSHSRPFVRFNSSLEQRDNRFSPTSGYYAEFEVEVTAGDVETIGVTVRGQRYWAMHETNERRKHVLGVRGQAAVVDSYSDHVPIFERLYAGGIGTLRGFEYEGVSPVDPGTGDQVGGESMLVGSVEYSVPIDPGNQFRVLGFMDAGYVTEDASDLLNGWDELRVSAGVGLRWLVPILGQLPLEIALGFPVVDEPEDEKQTFHLSFGATTGF